jgi:hypothetical protein
VRLKQEKQSIFLFSLSGSSLVLKIDSRPELEWVFFWHKKIAGGKYLLQLDTRLGFRGLTPPVRVFAPQLETSPNSVSRGGQLWQLPTTLG